MGTCCGKPTVWNDMCEDCNNKFDDMVYEGMGIEPTVNKADSYSSSLSPILDSVVFSFMLDVRDVTCLHGPVVEDDEVSFCISMKDGSDFLFLQSKMKQTKDKFMMECERIRWKFADYRSMN